MLQKSAEEIRVSPTSRPCNLLGFANSRTCVTKLCISSQKGGVGKTTVAVNLAYSLARRGWRVLLLDCDPQGSVGLSVTDKAATSRGFFDAMVGDSLEELLIETRLPEFQILTAGDYERFLKTPIAVDPDARRAQVETLFSQINLMDFEIIVVDTPAGTHSVTSDLLSVTDFVLIPEQAEPLAMRSLPQVLQRMAELSKKEPPIKVAGILATMVQREDPTSLDVLRQMRQMLPSELMLDTTIPRDPMFLRASDYGVPIGLLQKNPTPMALIFEQLAAELEGRMNVDTSEDEDATPRLIRLMD